MKTGTNISQKQSLILKHMRVPCVFICLNCMISSCEAQVLFFLEVTMNVALIHGMLLSRVHTANGLKLEEALATCSGLHANLGPKEKMSCRPACFMRCTA